MKPSLFLSPTSFHAFFKHLSKQVTRLRTLFDVFGTTCAHILFSARCLCCQRRTGTSYLCEDCRFHLKSRMKQQCPHCQERETPQGVLCHACREKSPLDSVWAVLDYRDATVKSVIHAYKFHFISSLATPLGERMVSQLRQTDIPLPHLLLPIPLHPYRWRWRGFNQSQLLAEHIASHLLPGQDIPLDTTLLVRKRFTRPQSKIKTRKERLDRLAGAFVLTRTSPVKGKIIWLIDDVSTTNATLTEASRILKSHGAREVHGIVLAR